MNDREGKSVDALSLEKLSRMPPLAFSVLLLLSLFFYLGSIYGSDGKARGIEDAVAGTGLKVSDCSQAQGSLARIVPPQFKSCNLSLQDLTPCTDPSVRVSPQLGLIMIIHCDNSLSERSMLV
jgi:hypothetical protein